MRARRNDGDPTALTERLEPCALCRGCSVRSCFELQSHAPSLRVRRWSVEDQDIRNPFFRSGSFQRSGNRNVSVPTVRRVAPKNADAVEVSGNGVLNRIFARQKAPKTIASIPSAASVTTIHSASHLTAGSFFTGGKSAASSMRR